MKLYDHELNNYRQLNTVARQGGIVLFGSTFAKNIPVGELIQSFELDCSLYNRSLTDLSVFDAASVLNDCILDLEPKRVLIQLGETDLERGYKSISEIISQYELIVNQIKSRLPKCHITLVSVCDTEECLFPEELNAKISALADRLGCQYADITADRQSEAPEVKAFCMLRGFFRDRITDYDALHMAFA